MALNTFNRFFQSNMTSDAGQLSPALRHIMNWRMGYGVGPTAGWGDNPFQMGGNSSGGGEGLGGGNSGDTPPWAGVRNQPTGNTPRSTPSHGGSLDAAGAARQALTTFNFRRNYAEGGLVAGPQTPPGVGAPQATPMNPQQLEGAMQQAVSANPQVIQQIQQAIMQALQSGQLTMDQLNMAVQLAKAAAQNPELWPRLRQMAIQQGLASEDELPPQYDQGIVFAILLAGQAAAQGMQNAQGGQQLGAPAGPTQGNYAEGGMISQSRSPTGDRSGQADDVKINVSAGEYVIPKHIVAAKGTEFFDRMLEQYDPKNPDSKVNKQ